MLWRRGGIIGSIGVFIAHGTEFIFKNGEPEEPSSWGVSRGREAFVAWAVSPEAAAAAVENLVSLGEKPSTVPMLVHEHDLTDKRLEKLRFIEDVVRVLPGTVTIVPLAVSEMTPWQRARYKSNDDFPVPSLLKGEPITGPRLISNGNRSN